MIGYLVRATTIRTPKVRFVDVVGRHALDVDEATAMVALDTGIFLICINNEQITKKKKKK